MKDRLAAAKKKYIPDDVGFYRDYIVYLFYIALGVMAGSIFFVLINTYQIIHRPFPVFYAQNQAGAIQLITPHAEPNYLSDTILMFAKRVAVASYTFDFNQENLERNFKQLRNDFTPGGWVAYYNSVQGVLTSVFKKKILINSVVSEVPVISNQGPLGNYEYAWRVQIPCLVTYQGESNPIRRSVMVTVVVVKVPTSVNPQGLAVDQLVMS